MRSGDGHVTELVDDAIEPVEIPMVFDGLEAISAEDGKGHGVDAGLAHQADVVIPDFLRPLVGTIVATESDAASVRGQQFLAMRSHVMHARLSPLAGGAGPRPISDTS